MEQEPLVTVEPYPGWQRWEIKGNTPFYKSPFPRTTITSMAKLKIFLAKEKDVGRYSEVEISKFSFKRRLGLRERSSGSTRPSADNSLDLSGLSADLEAGEGLSEDKERKKTVVELLTRDPEIILDHKKIMSREAKQLDVFRTGDVYDNPSNLEVVKVIPCE